MDALWSKFVELFRQAKEHPEVDRFWAELRTLLVDRMIAIIEDILRGRQAEGFTGASAG